MEEPLGYRSQEKGGKMHPSIITFSGMWLGKKNRFSDTLMLTKGKVTDEVTRTYIGTMQMQYSSSILLD